MSKIVFIKEPNIIYDGQFSQIGEHQVRLIFEDAVPSNDILLSLSNDIFDVEKLTITLFNLSSLLSPSSTSLAQFAQSKFNILYLYLFK